ncbi:Golgi apparatus protein 1 [Ischnura elegans]|uniref:Golgi apparatus protein 1 n=1 Tax=Ischnura elegans TaxID=197161 RepID=UPI001ED88648|nr:Golgi apparatus protein 1 [Ischnura elegans]
MGIMNRYSAIIYLCLVIVPSKMENSVFNGAQHDVDNFECVNCLRDNIKINEIQLNPVRRSRSLPRNEKLIESRECKPVVEELCKQYVQADDLIVLDCILSNDMSKVNRINESCRNILWAHSLEILEGKSLRSALQLHCSADLKEKNLSECVSRSAFPESSPSPIVSPILSCMLEYKEGIHNPRCKLFIQKIEKLVLFDFIQMMGPLAKYCEADVKQLDCSRNEVSWEGGTLACLQLKLDQVHDERCRAQIMQLSELQAEDVQLDRQLYKACYAEYNHLCRDSDKNVDAYTCLMRKRMDKSVGKKCANELSRRLGLVARDYKASKGFTRACRDDVRLNHCRRRRPHAAPDEALDVRLAHILLCLEGALRNGSSVSPDCRSGMVAHRRFLLEDYHTSPEVVSGCAVEVAKVCSGYEGAEVIHCLMENARTSHRRQRRISKACHRALEGLAREADIGENWTVDPVLKKACEATAQVHCPAAETGDAGVMTCLMELLGEDKLPDLCRKALLQIQYFVSREFDLDPGLYRHCHKDADRLCSTTRSNSAGGAVDGTAMVLPCLYRHAYHPLRDPQASPSEACVQQLRQVMKLRASSVDLQPEVEDNCLDELADFCQKKTGRGEEMVCLQDNLERLSAVCKAAVANYTELEAAHVEINPIIHSECKEFINKFCKDDYVGGYDQGGVMECLVAHKNDPEVRAYGIRCRAAVEHFQLISLKNYHFSYKFKEACRPHVVRYCPRSKTKMDVVSCLSERVRDETLSGQRPSISKECRQQLRAQLFQRRESIDLDPALKAACLDDAKQYCADKKHGDGQVLECLQAAKQRLSATCHRAIFNVEREELTDNSVDYTLLTACSKSLKVFCPHTDLSRALECLKKFRNKPSFDRKCQSVVIRRMIEQSSDYRLNPVLQADCKTDINKFCSHVVASQPKDLELEGKVVKCLKEKFHEHQLKKECERQISTMVIEAALNYEMNPALASACKMEVEGLCARGGGGEEEGGGAIEECLREKLVEGAIGRRECRTEVAASIRDSLSGSRLELDPLLQRACAADDAHHCANVPEGGNHILCLQSVMDNGNSLREECSVMLLKRIRMFNTAAMIVGYPPETMGELYAQVVHSPSRKYFLLVGLSSIGLFFILGLFCGRASRRNIVVRKR